MLDVLLIDLLVHKVVVCLPEELLSGISIGHGFQMWTPEFFPHGKAPKSLSSVMGLSVCDKADGNIAQT